MSLNALPKRYSKLCCTHLLHPRRIRRRVFSRRIHKGAPYRNTRRRDAEVDQAGCTQIELKETMPKRLAVEALDGAGKGKVADHAKERRGRGRGRWWRRKHGRMRRG